MAKRRRNHFSAQDKAIIRYLDLCFEYHDLVARMNELVVERLRAGLDGGLVHPSELISGPTEVEED